MLPGAFGRKPKDGRRRTTRMLRPFALVGIVPNVSNQLVGWIDGKRDMRTVPVRLRPSTDTGMAKDIGNVVGEISGISSRSSYDRSGRGQHLECVMKGMVMGEFVSYYMAILNGLTRPLYHQ